MKLSIVVPTYNERENIPLLVEKIDNILKGTDFELIVVDDDSPDETWKVAEELSKKYPFIKVIRRINERDLSTAVLRGFEEAEGEVFAVMDADLQHPPEKLKDMLEKMEKADVVVGSRYIEGGEIEEWGLIRKFYSRFATLLAHIFVPRSRLLKDPMSGFFMFKREVIEGIELNPIGYKILLEILAKGKYKRVEEEAKTASGIIIPDNAKEKPLMGKVVAISSEVAEDGDIAENDTVVFAKYSGTDITLEGDEYLVLNTDDILGILK